LISDVAAANRTQIDEARRGVITDSEVKRLADEMGMTEQTLLKRRKGQAFNAEEAMASRQVLVKSAEAVHAMAQSVAAGTGSVSDFSKAMMQHVSVQAQAAGVRAEAGRALRSFSQTADGNITKAVEAFLKNNQGTEIGEDIAKRLAQLDPLDTRSINKFIRDVSEGTFGDKVMEAWINGLLSGPQTHVVNTTSNALTLLSRPLLETPAEVALDFLGSTIRGEKRTRFLGEAKADLFSMFRGLPDAYTNAIRTFQDEIPTFAASKIDSRPSRQAIKGSLGRVVRIPGRALQAMDDFFKTLSQGGTVNARAYRDAAQKGLEGQAFVDHVASIVSRKNPIADSIWKAAEGEALYRTFQSPLPRSLSKLERGLRFHWSAQFIVPFVRTPINIAKFGLERTPLGFLNAAKKHGIKKLARPDRDWET